MRATCPADKEIQAAPADSISNHGKIWLKAATEEVQLLGTA